MAAYLVFIFRNRERIKTGSLPLWLYYFSGVAYLLIRTETFLKYPTIGLLVTKSMTILVGSNIQAFFFGIYLCCLISLVSIFKGERFR